MLKRRDWIAVGLLLTAFALAVYRLDAQDIWGDEAWSIALSQMPLQESLYKEANPPLYFLLLRAVRSGWGSSVFGIRYLSVLCSLVTVAIIGRIGKTVQPRGHYYALLAAAFAPFLLYYAQEARMYGPVMIGTSGSIAAFLHLLQRQRTARWWLLYIVCSLIAIFSHYYAFSVLLAVGIVTLLWSVQTRSWDFFGRMFATWCGMVAVFLPFFIQHRLIWGGQTDLRVAEWSLTNLIDVGRRTLIAFGAGTTISAEQQWIGWLIVGLGVLGVVHLMQHNRWAGITLTAVVVVGVLTAWALTPLLPFFWERYLLGVFPAFLVLVGVGAARIAQWQRMAALPIAFVLIALNSVPTWQYHTQPQYIKGGYGQTMRFITARAQDGDVILLNGPLQMALFDYYQPAQLAGKLIERDMLLDATATDTHLAELTGDARRVWLVASGNQLEFDPDNVASGWLAQQGSFALHRDFPGVGLDLFVMQAPTEPQATLAVHLADEVMLTGYAFASSELAAGEALIVTLFWQAQRPLDNAYTVFTHILDADGNLVAQVDRQPQGGSRPTNSWSPNEPIRDSYAITLPAELSAGTYTVQVGMYLWPELTRLLVQETGADHYALDTITITE